MFVLDFRNTHEQIQESFAPWYVRTHAELGPFDVLRAEEIETMVGFLLADPEKNHQRTHTVMQPAVDRLGKAAGALVDWEFFTIDGKDICRISMTPATTPCSRPTATSECSGGAHQ